MLLTLIFWAVAHDLNVQSELSEECRLLTSIPETIEGLEYHFTEPFFTSQYHFKNKACTTISIDAPQAIIIADIKRIETDKLLVPK